MLLKIFSPKQKQQSKSPKQRRVKLHKREILKLKASHKRILTRNVNRSVANRRTTARSQKNAEVLFVKNFPLAIYLAKKYFNKPDTQKDLIQVAAVGLLKASRNYCPEMKINFASYAIPTIEGEIKHYLRDNIYSIKIPRKFNELFVKLEKYKRDYLFANGQEISNEALAKKLKIKVRLIEEASAAVNVQQVFSYDSPLGTITNNSSADNLATMENILGKESNINRVVEQDGLYEALNSLETRERAILKDHFFREIKQEEIADKYNITQAQVSRIIKASCEKLKVVLA